MFVIRRMISCMIYNYIHKLHVVYTRDAIAQVAMADSLFLGYLSAMYVKSPFTT
jgi:hypothetical protein